MKTRSFLKVLGKLVISFLLLFAGYQVEAQNFALGEVVGIDGDGYGLSSAFGNTNKAAIAFFNAHDSKLKYVERQGLSWVSEVVDDSLQSPSDTALVIRNNIPNIFYINQQNQITRAYRENALWTKQVISTTEVALGDVSASLCGTDICISFYNSSQKKIKVARLSSNSWQIMSPDSSSADVGVMNDITQNNTGAPVVVYYDATNKTPKIASQQANASWVVESITYLNDKFGVNPSVTVDSAGTIHVASSRYRSLSTASDVAIYYSQKLVSGGWSTIEISRNYEGGPTDIALNSQSIVQVAYRHLQYNTTFGNLSDVRLGSVTNSGLWKQSTHKADLQTANLIYDIDKIAFAKDQWGSLSMAFSFSRSGYEQNSALMAIMYYGPQDSDNDQISDSAEADFGTQANDADSDDDGYIDGYEVYVLGTNPNDNDSDGDSILDVQDNCPKNINQSQQDSDLDGIGDVCDSAPEIPSSSSSSIPTTWSSSSSSSEGSSSSSSAAPVADPKDDQLDPDFDGLTNIEERQYGTNPQIEDTDGDGVGDGQEVVDGTSPRDKGSALAVLGTKLCTEWNGFLPDMDNIYELVNLSPRVMRAQVTLYQSNGTPSGRVRVRILPGSQSDILVHDMQGMEQLSAGRVCADHDGQPGDLDGRMVYYKRSELESNGDYQFAIALPASNGKIGEQYITFNTFQPGFTVDEQFNIVENWIQLTNLSNSSIRGSLYFYSQTGKLLKQYNLNLGSGVRRDFSGHQFGQNVIGLVRWKPERADLPLLMRNIRYVYDNPFGLPSYTGAAQFEGGIGTGQLISVPLDTRTGSSILEIANTRSKAIRTSVSLYSQTGKLLKRFYVSLGAFGSKHVITDSILGNEKIGLATIKSNILNSAMVTQMHYSRDLDGSLVFMYATPAQEALGTVLNGSYNTYLEHTNLLVVSNPTAESRSLNISVTRSDGKVIFGSRLGRVSYVAGQAQIVPPHGVLTLNINQLEGANNYGVVRVQADKTNSIVGWVLRQKGNNYLMPVPVRQ